MGDKVKQFGLAEDAAYLKITAWCAYQERSQMEVRKKLRSLGISGHQAEELIAKLIGENFINEERFALAYTGGKFRMKKWGRRKILQGLRQHQISEYCIKKALDSINEEEYLKVLRQLISKKQSTIKSGPEPLRAKKVFSYLLGHGFESNLIARYLKALPDDVDLSLAP